MPSVKSSKKKPAMGQEPAGQLQTSQASTTQEPASQVQVDRQVSQSTESQEAGSQKLACAEHADQEPAAQRQKPVIQEANDGENMQISGEPESIREYFRWRPLPWWLCFLIGAFLLTKLEVVYNASPCAVLGTQSPTGLAETKRAFRTLSMCTHPDRLRGRLGRDPTHAERRRGEILFNRASIAKERITKVLMKTNTKEFMCYSSELEYSVFIITKQIFAYLTALGISDLVMLVVNLVVDLVTFKRGFLNTLLLFLYLASVGKMVTKLIVYNWRRGFVHGVVAVFTAVVLGPIPTVVNFVILPFVRIMVFMHTCIFPPPILPPQARPSASDSTTGKVEPPEKPSTSTVTAESSGRETPVRNVRQRKKKETHEGCEQKLQEHKKEIHEESEQNANATTAASTQLFLWKRVSHIPQGALQLRQVAAADIQFDLLLNLTKPIIPLIMLVTTGQDLSGLVSSLIIGHGLRAWIPKWSYETQHLICLFFGAVHTVLGVSASQIEDHAVNRSGKLLHLMWVWSFKDVMSVMHMALLGATVAGKTSLGNEPPFTTSFAAGIALRIVMSQDKTRSLGAVKGVSAWIESRLKDLGIVLDQAEEVAVSSGNGIGDCGGGPFRMFLGNGPEAQWAARILKIWLMLLPLLSACLWFERLLLAGKATRKIALAKRRFVQRFILCALGLLQCYLLLTFELNASNGELANFWLAMLFGAVGESLLCTFNICGHVRQVIFFGLFVLI